MLGIAPDSNLPAKMGASSLSLRDVVFMLFRRRWIVLAVSLPIILIGGMSLFRQTGSYIAGCRVLVDLTRVDLPRWNTTGRNIDYDRELSTMFNIAMSLPVADMAAETLEDSIPVIKELLPNLMGVNRPGFMNGFLLEKFDVSAVGESNILEFKFGSGHPRVSLMAVGAMRDAFVEYQVHGRRNLKAVAYYHEQLQTVQNQVDSLLSARTKILTDTGYASVKDQIANEVGQMSRVDGHLLEATADRRILELEYETLKSYLDGDPLDFPFGLDENRSPTLVRARSTVSKHQEDLNNILAVHTKDSIPARRQLDLIDRALENLHQEEVAYVESVRLRLISARSREQTLKEQYETLRVSSSKGPEAWARVSLVDVEIESLRTLLKNIQGKVGEVRLSQLADERVSSVTSLTDPEMLMSLSGGKTMVYFIMIAIFAIALGIVVALILESMDHRVYHPKDIEENLQLPVFASVTRTD